MQIYKKRLILLLRSSLLCISAIKPRANHRIPPSISISIIQSILFVNKEVDAVGAFVPPVLVKTIGLDYFPHLVNDRRGVGGILNGLQFFSVLNTDDA